jgi:phthiodiolone/phenolphthiodiolone dimycocerosates ketoreductase
VTLKLGVYGRFSPPLDDAVRFTAECERIGLDVVAFTDQIAGNLPNDLWSELDASHFAPLQHNFLDPSVTLAMSAAATSSIELYLGAIDVVRHAPSKLAQQFVSLSHASKGRAWFALGASEMKNIGEFGHSRIGSGDKLEDSLEIIRKLFDSDGAPVVFEGKQYSMKGGRFELEPYGGTFPLVLAATGGSPETLGRIGAHADGLMTNLPGMCHGGPAQFARDRQIVRDAAERAGRDPDNLRFAASVLVVMHDDEETLQRLARTTALQWDTIVYGAVVGAEWRQFGFEHPLGDEWAYARHLRPEKISGADAKAAAAKVPPEAVLQMGHWGGTAEQVADKIKPYVEAGLDYAIVVDYAPFGDPTLAATSAGNLDRLAKELTGKSLGSSSLGWLGIGQDT